MTLVGTLKGNKKEVSDAVKGKVTLPPGSTASLFTRDLVFYVPDRITKRECPPVVVEAYAADYEGK